MEDQVKNNNYFDFLTKRTWITWLWSGLIAVGLNLGMFLFLPYMVDPEPPQATLEDVIPFVNVIRMKQPEKEVRRKPVEPPKPPEVKPIPTPQKVPARPFQKRLVLPFELNPLLPKGPASLELPPLESVPLKDIGAFQGTFALGQLDGPLTPLAKIPPVYPIRARRKQIQGWVKVAFIVDKTGKVGEVTILKAEPPGLFEKSVDQCVRSWQFKPGTVEGMPVRTKVETTIQFRLE